MSGSIPLLQPGNLLWDTLESVQTGPEDLIHICVGGIDRLVGAEILPKIGGHVGDLVTIWNIDGRFYAGVVSL